nr:unnamed protein product [Digitaria exilis]
MPPDEKEHRGRGSRRRAAHFVEQSACVVEAAVLGEDGEHGVLRRGPPERRVRGAADVAEARQRGHHERLGRLGAAPVEGPRGVRRIGGGTGLGRRDDGIDPSGDVRRELLLMVIREGEGAILAAISEMVSGRSCKARGTIEESGQPCGGGGGEWDRSREHPAQHRGGACRRRDAG